MSDAYTSFSIKKYIEAKKLAFCFGKFLLLLMIIEKEVFRGEAIDKISN